MEHFKNHCIIILISVLYLILAVPSAAQQPKVVHGKHCECIEKYNQQFSEETEELGFTAVPEPYLPQNGNIQNYLITKLGEKEFRKHVDTTLVLRFYISEQGNVECVYLILGELIEFIERNVLPLISELKFKPAKIRQRRVPAFYELLLKP